MKTSKKKLIWALAILGGLGIAAWLGARAILCSPLPFAADQVAEIRFRLELIFSEEQKLECATTDKEAIGNLTSAVAGAWKTFFNHRCAWIGVLSFRLTNGRTFELDIRPGHDENYYECAWGEQLLFVDREPFLLAMKAVGVDRARLLGPWDSDP